jgi:protein-S-isoprenylcysteine O-methyltransferase Ste14
VVLRRALQDAISPSATRSTAALWAKSLLNAVLFFGIFMVVLPGLAHRLLPVELSAARGPRVAVAVVLFGIGMVAWLGCLDTFSRRGRGTPLPMDAPRRLVTAGAFAFVRNPIMAAELLVIWAEALYVASLGIALYAAAITALAHLLVVHVEEPELRRRFGAPYDEYTRNVPRWLPRLPRRQSTGS